MTFRPNLQESYFLTDGKPTLAGIKVLDGLYDRITALEENNLSAQISQAEREVLSTYGDTVSVSEKAKSLLKFGRNDNVGTSSETVWTYGGDETYATTNAITSISSSNAGDTGQVQVEGHTVTGTGDAAVYTFRIQTVTLTGQTAATLTTPLARVSRVFNVTDTELLGDIYIFETDTLTAGVPDTASKVHLQVPAGSQQSFKCATTFSGTDYAFITNAFCSVNKKQTANVDFELQRRMPGQSFRPIARLAASTTGQTTVQINFEPFLIIPKNSDVRMVAVSNAAATSVEASFQCYLAAVQ